MRLEDIHSVYFVGIGGIGMSALARWFNSRGANVAGYDRVSTPLTQTLEAEGIVIHYDDDVNLIPDQYKDKDSTLVIFTPAIPKDHKELNYLIENGFSIKKRSEVLGIITSSKYAIGVAGTHGKTTTSSMIAHILNESEKGCNAFVGGIMTNNNSNLIIGKEDAPVVVEADEFDRSFLRLHPNVSVVTSVDPDHLDIYGNPDAMKKSFGEYIQKTNASGKVFMNVAAVDKLSDIETAAQKVAYGFEQGEIQAQNLRIQDGEFVFDYVSDNNVIKDLKLLLPGYHNVENAVAAISVALNEGLSGEQIKASLASYKGVKRRFEYIIKDENQVFIDDYAHHPSEIRALVKSVRSLYPGKRITAIFQPHLYSRTKDFVDGFALELSKVDELILLPIYPAREEPIPGVESELILVKTELENSRTCQKGDLIDVIDQIKPEVLLTVGAGDIDQLVPKIAVHLNKGKEVNNVS